MGWSTLERALAGGHASQFGGGIRVRSTMPRVSPPRRFAAAPLVAGIQDEGPFGGMLRPPPARFILSQRYAGTRPQTHSGHPPYTRKRLPLAPNSPNAIATYQQLEQPKSENPRISIPFPQNQHPRTAKSTDPRTAESAESRNPSFFTLIWGRGIIPLPPL